MSIEAKLHRPHGALTTLSNGRHAWCSDVDKTLGSHDQAPDPHDLLDSALAACTALTLELYVRRHQMPITDLRVTVTHVGGKNERGQTRYELQRHVFVDGDLTQEDRQRLLDIANKCPIHKLLNGEIEIQSDIT